MKLQFLICVLSLLAYQKCNDAIVLEEKPPFEIEEAFFTLIPSGTKDGRSKVEVEIHLRPDPSLRKQGIWLKALYFRENLIELQESQPNCFKGSIYIQNQGLDEHDREPEASDVPSDTDPQFKQWNQQLKANEGVLYFEKNKKQKFYKLVLKKTTLTSVPM